jgi:anti-sigma B factor antagonist
MPSLDIAERTVDDAVVLTLDGHLVADEGDVVLRERVKGLVGAGTLHILVDLRNVTHMDSGGAGALAAILLHVARRGGALKLVCPSGRVCRVLQVTHLQNVFDVYENEEQALRSFQELTRAPEDRL